MNPVRNAEQEEAIRADIDAMRNAALPARHRAEALARLRAAGFRNAAVKFYPGGDSLVVLTQGRTLAEAVEQAVECCAMAGLPVTETTRATAEWIK